MAYVLIACRCTLGLVFAYSALTKLWGRSGFVAFTASVRRMRVLPDRLTVPVAKVVVAVELLVPVLLLVRPTVVAGFLAGLALLTAFTTGILSVIRRRIVTSCRCFGATDVSLGWQHVARNAGLLAVAVLGLVGAAAPGQGTATAGVVLSVAVALILAFVIATVDDLVALFR